MDSTYVMPLVLAGAQSRFVVTTGSCRAKWSALRLQRYMRSSMEPNMTTLAMQGLPSGGEKDGKLKRKRSRV